MKASIIGAVATATVTLPFVAATVESRRWPGLTIDELTPSDAVLKKHVREECTRLIIVLPGAYGATEAMFWNIHGHLKRGHVVYVENPSLGYDGPATARMLAGKLRKEWSHYTDIAIISLSMGAGAAMMLMEHLARDGWDPERVKWIPIAPSLRNKHLRGAPARLSARFNRIGPVTNRLLQPVLNAVLLRAPKPGRGATKQGMQDYIHEVRRRFTARAIFMGAAEAMRLKEFPPDLLDWYKQVQIAYPYVVNDPVVDNLAALAKLRETHPNNFVAIEVFEGRKVHCSLPEDPWDWDAVLEWALDAVGFTTANI